MSTSLLISRRAFVANLAGVSALCLLPKIRAAIETPARIRVGCQANGFKLKPDDFPALLAAARSMRELGYEGFECNVRFVQGQFGNVGQARKQLDETGIEFISAHTSMQLAQTEVFPNWVDSVAALGGKAIIMSETVHFKDGKFTRDELAKKASDLNALARICRKGGLRLAYHNHNPEFANRNAEINGLADLTDPDLVDFLMDAGHAHLGGGDPAAFMRRDSKRIYGCHLKTFKGGQAHQVPLGQGDWGFEDLAQAVKETGWKGWLLSEEGGMPAPPDTAALGPDREYIRRVFGA